MRPAAGTLFINPRSGEKQEALAHAIGVNAKLLDYDVVRIGRGIEIANLARERLAQGQKNFVAAGGDGTVNHVMQALVNTDATLGVIPLGTFNHLAKDAGIPLDWESALEVATRGTIRQIDVARVNDRYFLNNISLGLYPEMLEMREAQRHVHGRWLALARASYVAFRDFPHVAISIEAPPHFESVRTHLFMVSNNVYDLSRVGAEAPRASLESGALSVYWLPHLPKLKFIGAVARYLRGNLHSVGGLRLLRTRSLRVSSSRSHIRLGIDGELFEMATPLSISIVPGALQLRVPREA